MRSTLSTSNFTRQPCRQSSVCVCVSVLICCRCSTSQLVKPPTNPISPQTISYVGNNSWLKHLPWMLITTSTILLFSYEVVIQKSHLHHQPSSTIIINHHQPSSTVINQSPVIYRIQGHLVKEAFRPSKMVGIWWSQWIETNLATRRFWYE